METVIVEAEVPESVATALTRLPAEEKALLRRVVGAAVAEFTQAASTAPSSDVDAWDAFLAQSSAIAVDGLPADFSVNHDHYLHGAPKRDTSR